MRLSENDGKKDDSQMRKTADKMYEWAQARKQQAQKADKGKKK